MGSGAATDPKSGLRFFDLSHPWGHGTPVWPGYPGVVLERGSFHALHGTLTQRFTTVMHASTHVNAPLHLVAGGTPMGSVPIENFFGTAVVLSIPKGKWQMIEAEDLEVAVPTIQTGDIVLINTGWHETYSDSQQYFAHGPGLSEGAARWLVEKKVRLVGMDTATVDHPLATALGAHRGGPILRALCGDYQEETGDDPRAVFPDWQPAHRMLLDAGIPTIEEIGGQINDISGSRVTVAALPWKWKEGDASIIRLVAIVDDSGNYRLGGEAGETSDLVLHDLTQSWGHDVSFWPGKNPIHEFRRHQYHARDDAQVLHFTTVMHRGTHMDCPIHVLPNTHDITGFELWKFFGTGVAVSIPKGRWDVITPEDLEQATPRIEPGDIVMINTGYHRHYGDNSDYYAYSPGLYKEAAEWLVERGVKMVGIDVQALDHPLGTYLGPHGPGPFQPHLNDEYKAQTGHDIIDDFPLWEPAHKVLMSAGIPGIENIGGDLDAVTGKRMTFMAFPWRWTGGDGSGVRVVGVEDPSGTYRL